MSLAYVVVEHFLATRERYGIYSMEFVMATTYALKIIELVRTYDCTTSDGSEKLKILKILNMKQMAKAWSTLPKTTQNYFKNCVQNCERQIQ